MAMDVPSSCCGSLPGQGGLDVGPAMGLGAEQPDDERGAHVIPSPRLVQESLVRRDDAVELPQRMVLTASTVKGGTIAYIVPMVSHVDHTEHDVHVVITEQGVAGLHGLPPRRRAQQVINRCAHPGYRPALQDYLDRTTATGPGKHTPHLPGEALSWHVRYLHEGTMRAG